MKPSEGHKLRLSISGRAAAGLSMRYWRIQGEQFKIVRFSKSLSGITDNRNRSFVVFIWEFDLDNQPMIKVCNIGGLMLPDFEKLVAKHQRDLIVAELDRLIGRCNVEAPLLNVVESESAVTESTKYEVTMIYQVSSVRVEY